MREFQLIFLILLSFQIISNSFAEQPIDLRFIHLTTENGLSSSEITDIAQDKEGFIWISTSDGLNRYDGRSIKVYRREAGDPTTIPENHIKSLFVDSSGDLWIVLVRKGILRYNKKTDTFENYSSNPTDSTSLIDDIVSEITEDSLHRVLVASYMGINSFNRKTNNFTQFRVNINPELFISEEGIAQIKQQIDKPAIIQFLSDRKGKSILQDQLFRELGNEFGAALISTYRDLISLTFNNKNLAGTDLRVITTNSDGLVYIGYSDGVISILNPQKMKFKHLRFCNSRTKNQGDFFVTNICVQDDKIWVATRGEGIWIYDTRLSKWTKFTMINETFVKSIIKDIQGNIWIGGSGSGLSLYDTRNKSISTFGHNDADKYSLSNNNISSIFEDSQKNLWIGSTRGDVNFTDKQNPFKSINNITHNNVSAVLNDRDNLLWIGYYNEGGIDIIDRFSGEKRFIAPGEAGLGKGTVQCIFEDSQSNIWVGTYLGGLQLYDKRTNRFSSFLHNPDDDSSIGSNDVRKIDEDNEGNLWLAVHGAGIDKFDVKERKFTHFQRDLQSPETTIGSNWTFAVFCDHQNQVWVGTIDGFTIFNKEKSTIKNYRYHENSKGLSSNFVYTFYQDSKGRMWIGTSFGLDLFDQKNETFTLFDRKSGLANDNVSGITEDNNGYLWITTYKGLSCYNPEKHEFKNYYVTDGLKTDEFIIPSGIDFKNGELFLGGSMGLIDFKPDQIKRNNFIPPVYITGLKLFNQPVPVSSLKNFKGFHLQNAITFTNAIRLKYNQNVFTFHFVTLNYLQPEKNQYAYRMEGFDEEWNFIGNKNEVTYTNLKPGSYVFRVKASNNDNLWNEKGDFIRVIITPPWWKTGWAYASYSIIILLLLFYFRYQVRQREKYRQKHKLDMMKLRFFTNISHEFRTPLTLIKAPLEKLISTSTDEELRFQYSIISRNVKRLLRLINQLMDVRKLEAGGLKLQVVEQDIVAFVRGISDSFTFEAKKRNIDYRFHSEIETIVLQFDPDKMDKVFYNLIANAFKFTPEGKSISIEISLGKANVNDNSTSEIVEIKVENVGIGIPNEALPKIFERFYQAENVRNGQGTGIGLSLSKELVELHHGKIVVTSETGKSTCLTVQLPKENECLLNFLVADRLDENPSESIADYIDDQQVFEEINENAHPFNTGTSSLQPILLIVEDNIDLRHFIKFEFLNSFNVIEAADGNSGYEKAIEFIPDLIISDIMMPGMDGLQLCEKLKTDEKTCHIPIIILTALSGEGQILKGFETGADDYIVKPFAVSLLRARVKNLIESRKILRKQFSKLPDISSAISVSNLDQQFVNKIIQVIENHISQSGFDAILFARELGLSRAQLYRKIHALTGCTVNEFIRNVRLKKSAELLIQGKFNISEVAYEVGFSSGSYFSKCFTQYYSESPTKFIEKHQKTSVKI